jgi:hypothetical protein
MGRQTACYFMVGSPLGLLWVKQEGLLQDQIKMMDADGCSSGRSRKRLVVVGRVVR